jgi:hypothetical protein
MRTARLVYLPDVNPNLHAHCLAERTVRKIKNKMENGTDLMILLISTQVFNPNSCHVRQDGKSQVLGLQQDQKYA